MVFIFTQIIIFVCGLFVGMLLSEITRQKSGKFIEIDSKIHNIPELMHIRSFTEIDEIFEKKRRKDV